MGVLRQADGWRQGRLVSSEYDETTWAARNYMAFAAQRISVAAQISLAQEIAEALGLSVAADPRVSGPWPLGDGGRGGWARAGTVLHTCGELVGLRYWLIRVWVLV